MSEGKPENPPAFPHMAAEGHRDYVPGMTLRDYFAGQGLAGYFANPEMGAVTREQVARDCYDMADAMLTERAALSKTGAKDE